LSSFDKILLNYLAFSKVVKIMLKKTAIQNKNLSFFVFQTMPSEQAFCQNEYIKARFFYSISKGEKGVLPKIFMF
jgi:hypothetical protein